MPPMHNKTTFYSIFRELEKKMPSVFFDDLQSLYHVYGSPSACKDIRVKILEGKTILKILASLVHLNLMAPLSSLFLESAPPERR